MSLAVSSVTQACGIRNSELGAHPLIAPLLYNNPLPLPRTAFPHHTSRMSSPGPGPDARSILKAHFSVSVLPLPSRLLRNALTLTSPLEQQGAQWSALWDQGNFLPWDRHAPSPALIDLLAERKEELGLVGAKEKGLKALVPVYIPGPPPPRQMLTKTATGLWKRL
jgi:hypothetical protein